MARRRPDPTPEPTPAATEAVPETPQPIAVWLSDHLVGRRAETRDDHILLEAVTDAWKRSERLVREFVDEQLAAGFTVTDLNELYVVERCLVPTLEDVGGRLKVRMETRIVERVDEEQA